MANVITNLFGGSKAKTTNNASKGLEKATATLGELQKEQQKLTTQKNQLTDAISVISANLVIDENDKTAQKQLEKAQAKIKAIESQLTEVSGKVQEAQEAVTQAQKEVKLSKGEVFKSEYIKDVTRAVTVKGLEKQFSKIKESNDAYKIYNNNEWGQAYGFQPTDTLNGYKLPTPEQERFAVEIGRGATTEAQENAQRITEKVMKAVHEILEAEGVELKK
jgi:hypothetical protein